MRTNWRTIISRKFLHCGESSRAHNRFPCLGIWQKNWEPPGNLTLKTTGIWLQNFHRTKETDSWRAQRKPCVHQDPETPLKMRQNCVWTFPVEVQVSSGLPQGQGLWCGRLGYGMGPLGGGCHHPHLRAARTYTGLGNRLIQRAQTEHYVHQVPGESSNDPTRDWPRLARSVQETPAEAWISGGLL